MPTGEVIVVSSSTTTCLTVGGVPWISSSLKCQQTHGSSSRAGIIYEYVTQVITTFTTCLIVYVPKAWLHAAMSPLPKKCYREGFMFPVASCLPDHSQAHDFYSKRRQHVRMWRNKEEGTRGHSLLTAQVFIRTHVCCLLVCFSPI